jgi:hypothetical protein
LIFSGTPLFSSSSKNRGAALIPSVFLDFLNFCKGACKMTYTERSNHKQERNSNQARALLGHPFQKADRNGFFRIQVLLKSSEIPEFRNNLAFCFLIILNSGEKNQISLQSGNMRFLKKVGAKQYGDGPNNRRTDEVSYRGAMLAPKKSINMIQFLVL